MDSIREQHENKEVFGPICAGKSCVNYNVAIPRPQAFNLSESITYFIPFLL